MEDKKIEKLTKDEFCKAFRKSRELLPASFRALFEGFLITFSEINLFFYVHFFQIK